MKIHGLQKMTLLDYPGKVACTVFLGGCDFRCPYCHNAELWNGLCPPLMEEEELLAFLQKRRGLLDGVAVTGGEPLLQKELPALLARIRAMGFSIKLDTNGTHPERLRTLMEEGLVDYVAMDIKNSQEKYAKTVGLPQLNLAPVKESVSLLLEGRVPYEFRTTVCRELHKDADILSIAQWIQGASAYYIQPFTDRDTVPCHTLHAPEKTALKGFISIAAPYVSLVSLRGESL